LKTLSFDFNKLFRQSLIIESEQPNQTKVSTWLAKITLDN